MMDKIFVILGLALAAILVIENMVSWLQAYVFIDSWAKAWFLSFVSVIVGIFVWYGIRWLISKNKNDDYDSDLDF